MTLQEENDKPEATRYFYGDNEDKSLVQELNWLHADTKLKISKNTNAQIFWASLAFLISPSDTLKQEKS